MQTNEPTTQKSVYHMDREHKKNAARDWGLGKKNTMRSLFGFGGETIEYSAHWVQYRRYRLREQKTFVFIEEKGVNTMTDRIDIYATTLLHWPGVSFTNPLIPMLSSFDCIFNTTRDRGCY